MAFSTRHIMNEIPGTAEDWSSCSRKVRNNTVPTVHFGCPTSASSLRLMIFGLAGVGQVCVGRRLARASILPPLSCAPQPAHRNVTSCRCEGDSDFLCLRIVPPKPRTRRHRRPARHGDPSPAGLPSLPILCARPGPASLVSLSLSTRLQAPPPPNSRLRGR